MASQSGLTLPTVLSSVVAHPLSQQQLDDSQSEVSSALTDLDAYHDLWEVSDKMLDYYTPTELPDPTHNILVTFRQMLSHQGATALMSDIKTIGRDQVQLKSFSRYLVNTILKPSKSFLVPSSNVATQGNFVHQLGNSSEIASVR